MPSPRPEPEFSITVVWSPDRLAAVRTALFRYQAFLHQRLTVPLPEAKKKSYRATIKDLDAALRELMPPGFRREEI